MGYKEWWRASLDEARRDRAERANPRVIVRTYRGTPRSIARAFERDARRLATRGYVPAEQSGIAGHRGGMGTAAGIATLGVAFLLKRPKDALVVTYRRED